MDEQIAIGPRLAPNARTFAVVRELDVNELHIGLAPIHVEYCAARRVESSRDKKVQDLNSDFLDAAVEAVVFDSDGDCIRLEVGIDNVTTIGRESSAKRWSGRGQNSVVVALQRSQHPSVASVDPSARQ